MEFHTNKGTKLISMENSGGHGERRPVFCRVPPPRPSAASVASADWARGVHTNLRAAPGAHQDMCFSRRGGGI